jgi:hypothetical protein
MIIRGLRCIVVVVSSVPRRTTINIPLDVKTELEKIRRELGAEDWAKFFKRIIEIYSEWRRVKAESEVRDVMCNEFGETQASLPAWGKLLASRLQDPDKIYVAMKYLVQVDMETLGVDKSKCT